MKADVRYMRAGEDSEARYDAINMMPVSYEEFATESNLFWRAYGVLTGESNGFTGADNETLVSYTLNRCARAALYRQLLETTQETERALGYKLSERYLVMDEPYRGSKIALPHPGVTTLEVERTWHYTEFTAEPEYLLEEGLTIFQDGLVFIARISAVIFENPDWAIIRNESNSNKVVPPDKGHARYAEYDSGTQEWLIPLVTNLSPVTLIDVLNAQHRRYARITVPKPLPATFPVIVLQDDAIFVAVYPGTNQIIPMDVIEEDDNQIIYQVNVWLLVDQAFQEEVTNWERFQLYKFYREIPFAYYEETPRYLELIWTNHDCQTVYQYDPDDADAANLPRLSATLVDAARGIIHLTANNQLVRDLYPYWRACCTCSCQTMPETVTIRVPYKVEPQALQHRLYEQIDDIEQAIIHRVAAELPTSDCGCRAEAGFVFENQMPYLNAYMNPFTAVEVTKREFGRLHGQMIYNQKMSTKQIYRRPIRVGNI